MNNLFEGAKIVNAIVPNTASGNTPLVSGIIDRVGYQGPVEFVITTGVLTTGGATYAVTMEHGDDSALADTAAPAAAQLVGTLAAASFAQANGSSVFHVGYNGPKRYLRLTITPTGSTGAASIAAAAVLQRPVFSGASMP